MLKFFIKVFIIHELVSPDNSTFESRHAHENPTMWFPNRSDSNRAVQALKMARGFFFYLRKKWRNCTYMYYSCSKNKGADQLHSYCKAELHLCFRNMQNDVAHFISCFTGLGVDAITAVFFVVKS